MGNSLYLYHREDSVKTLGPGERYVIWTQGCPHRCKGCLAQDSQTINENGYWIGIDKIFGEIFDKKKKNDIRGVTISGGEPFYQSKVLSELLEKIVKLNLDVICYTGYRYEELLAKQDKYIGKILQNIDILIDGKYEESKNENNYLKGSSNQRIICLSNRYKEYEKKMNELKSRNVEIKFIEEGKIFITGVPPLNFEEKMQRIKNKILE